MVNTNTLRACQEKQKLYFKIATTVNVNNCLKQIRLSLSLCSCAPISELPTNISTVNPSRNARNLLGASEVSGNLYCNLRTSVLGRLRDYLRFMKRSVYVQEEVIHFK